MAITLWKLGTNIEYQSLSSDVRSAIVECRAKRYIAVPVREHLQLVVDGFMSNWGVPQCVGAINSTHIPIIAPKNNLLVYYNCKGYHSVMLQALVDHKYKFLDVFVSWPGSVHDAQFNKSRLVFEV